MLFIDRVLSGNDVGDGRVLIELQPTVADGPIANRPKVLQNSSVVLQLVHAIARGNLRGIGIVADLRPRTRRKPACVVHGNRAVRTHLVQARQSGSQGGGTWEVSIWYQPEAGAVYSSTK